MIPDLPDATYDVWVRDYGLVDSPKQEAEPGRSLEPESGEHTWVDQQDVLGFGPNTPINAGIESEGFLVLDDGEWIVLRVPCPTGFYTKWVNGRIRWRSEFRSALSLNDRSRTSTFVPVRPRRL